MSFVWTRTKQFPCSWHRLFGKFLEIIIIVSSPFLGTSSWLRVTSSPDFTARLLTLDFALEEKGLRVLLSKGLPSSQIVYKECDTHVIRTLQVLTLSNGSPVTGIISLFDIVCSLQSQQENKTRINRLLSYLQSENNDCQELRIWSRQRKKSPVVSFPQRFDVYRLFLWEKTNYQEKLLYQTSTLVESSFIAADSMTPWS